MMKTFMILLLLVIASINATILSEAEAFPLEVKQDQDGKKIVTSLCAPSNDHSRGIFKYPPSRDGSGGVFKYPPSRDDPRGIFKNPPSRDHDSRGVFKYPPRMRTCYRNPRVCHVKGSPGQSCCYNRCVDRKNDRFNCGRCGIRCRFSEICCNGKCVNPMFHRSHCGGCFRSCNNGNSCFYGMCGYAYA